MVMPNIDPQFHIYEIELGVASIINDFLEIFTIGCDMFFFIYFDDFIPL